MTIAGLIVFCTTAAVAMDPPATVLTDRLEITLNGARTREERTWTVRIDDPEAGSAGILAPEGLDGATAGPAKIIEGILLFPETVEKGTTWTFSRRRPSVQAGWLLSAPDLPAETTQLVIKGSDLDFAITTDGLGNPSFEKKRTIYTWSHRSAEQPVQVAWSLNTSWISAGKQLEKELAPKLASRVEDLGRDLAISIDHATLALLVQRLDHAVALQPGPSSWATVRSVRAIVADGQGTAAERGLVLLSMLKFAGYQAYPAATRHGPPLALASTAAMPALLDHPLIAIEIDNRTLWLDPGALWSTPGVPPASLTGRPRWKTSDLPEDAPWTTVSEGSVAISGSWELDAEGSSHWRATLAPTGTAVEALRERLAPLSDTERSEILRRRVAEFRPHIDRWYAELSGIEDRTRPVRIELQAHETRGISSSQDISPLLAPALASWLPGSTTISETTIVQWTMDKTPLQIPEPSGIWTTEGWAAARLRAENHDLILETWMERYADSGSIRRQREFERQVAGVHFFPPILALPWTPKLSTEDFIDLPPEEVAAIQIAAAWRNAPGRSTKKQWKKQLASIESLERLAQYAGPSPAPWQWLSRYAKNEETQWVIARELAKRNEWTLAQPLLETIARTGKSILAAQAAAWLAKYDPAWWPQAESLAAHQPKLADITVQSSLIRGDVVSARAAANHLDNRLPEHARLLAKLQTLEAISREERQMAWYAAASIGGSAAHFDEISEALWGQTNYRASLGNARVASQLEPTPERWLTVSTHALSIGDLPLAADAAEKAFQLDTSKKSAEWAIRLGLLANRQEQVQRIAREAGLPEPTALSSFESRLDAAGSDALLAVLEHETEEVSTMPSALSLRAQLRLESGRLDDAARDGLLLYQKHNVIRGFSIFAAATAGRWWSLGLDQRLSHAGEEDPLARAVLTEMRWMSGQTLPKDSEEDLRTRPLLDLASKPTNQTNDPAWKPPAGWKSNPVLGSAPGISAWSNSALQRSILLSTAGSEQLPPPLQALYIQPKRPEHVIDGIALWKLSGGPMPVWAASCSHGDGGSAWSLGFTATAAEQAIQLVAE